MKNKSDTKERKKTVHLFISYLVPKKGEGRIILNTTNIKQEIPNILRERWPVC